jgi:ELWxxDGT repeat protein
LVKDIAQGLTPSGLSTVSSAPKFLTNVNGTLYFSAAANGFTGNSARDGFELWKSDGTAAGTVMVKDSNPPNGSLPSFLTNVSGTLYFSATEGLHGSELWKSDGTAAGTVMVKDIVPGSGSSSPFDLAAVNGVLEFYAGDGTSLGLFRSDGTAAGTIELATNIEATTALGVTFPSNGDSFSDIQWQNADGQASIWDMNGNTLIGGGR